MANFSDVTTINKVASTLKTNLSKNIKLKYGCIGYHKNC